MHFNMLKALEDKIVVWPKLSVELKIGKIFKN